MLQQSWCQMMRDLIMWIEYESHRFSAGRIRVIACGKQQQQVFCFEETHCFSNLYWDNGKWRWMREHIYVSGSLSVQWAATDIQSIPYYWSYQLDIKWLLLACVKMRQGGVSQNTAWSGIAIPANRKTCHWEELQSYSILNPCPPLWRMQTWQEFPFLHTRLYQQDRSCLLQHTKQWLNKHGELILPFIKQKSDFWTLKQPVISALP